MQRIFLVSLLTACLLRPVFAEPGWDTEGVKKQAAELLKKEDFAGLDLLAGNLKRKGYDIRQSDPELSAYYRALNLNSNLPDSQWLDHRSRIERWNQMRPGSLSAKIALAEWYIGYGWKAKGPAYGGRVPDEIRALINERFRQASRILKSVPEASVDDPEYYWLWIILEAQPDRQNAGSGKTAFLKGTILAKEYYPLYSERAFLLLPKWIGQPGDWERFLTTAANSFPSEKGDILYARVARAEAHHYGDGFFKETKVDYTRIKRGYLLGTAFHGGSTRVADLSNLCYLAAIQGDRDTAVKLFLDLGDSIYRSSFGNNDNFIRLRKECGGEAVINRAFAAERAGKLEEAERAFAGFHPEAQTNPWLKSFYRREGLTAKLRPLMYDNQQTYAQILDLDINAIPPDKLFLYINVAPLAGEWDKAEAAARLFDQKRPWNIVGKNILWLCALRKGDRQQSEAVQNAILKMKTDREPYEQAQQVLSGAKTWDEVRAEVTPEEDYGAQACETIALYYAAKGDTAGLQKVMDDMVAQGAHPDIVDVIQSLLVGNVGRSLTQTASPAPTPAR